MKILHQIILFVFVLVLCAGCEKVQPVSEKERMISFFESLRGKTGRAFFYYPTTGNSQVLSNNPSIESSITFSRDITHGDSDDFFVVRTPDPINRNRVYDLENIPGKLIIVTFPLGGELAYNHRTNTHLATFQSTDNEYRVTANDIGTVDYADILKGKLEIISPSEFRITGRTESSLGRVSEPRMYVFKDIR